MKEKNEYFNAIGLTSTETRIPIMKMNDFDEGHRIGYETAMGKMRWVSVGEKVPANNETVIVWTKTPSGSTHVSVAQYTTDLVMTMALLDRDGKPLWYDWLTRSYSHDAVMYWMPLPEPPAFEMEE